MASSVYLGFIHTTRFTAVLTGFYCSFTFLLCLNFISLFYVYVYVLYKQFFIDNVARDGCLCKRGKCGLSTVSQSTFSAFTGRGCSGLLRYDTIRDAILTCARKPT